MGYVLSLLIIALTVKDATPLGDSYILRGISEGLALVLGVNWFLFYSRKEIYGKYWLIFGYIIILFSTIAFSARPVYVALQVISLTAVLFFFIAYIETSPNEVDKNETVINVTIIVFTLVCLTSLILLAYRPSWVYEVTLEGRRFKGLFGKPAKMGITAGLLLGLSLFRERNFFLRSIGVLLSIPCLYLAGARTFWFAAAAGVLVTAALYLKRKLAWCFIIVATICLTLFVGIVADMSISSKDRSRILRADSFERMSGRTVIWRFAFEKFRDRPILGYGFTLGADAFKEGQETRFSAFDASPSLLKKESFTMHSGYVQALLDSGILGTVFYISIIISVLWALIKNDKDRRHGAVMYSICFLTISNLGETVVFSAAVLHAVFYWYLAIFALSLRWSNESNGDNHPSDVEKGMIPMIVPAKRKYEILKTV